MKEKDVPQDKKFLIEGRVRDLCYAVDEDGNYKQVMSTGWDPKNEAIEQAWNEIHENAKTIAGKVLEGTLSPIAYYMEKAMMDVKLLAGYTGFLRLKVKRHLKPLVYKSLKEDVKQKYADVFKITVQELDDIQRIKEEIGESD